MYKTQDLGISPQNDERMRNLLLMGVGRNKLDFYYTSMYMMHLDVPEKLEFQGTLNIE